MGKIYKAFEKFKEETANIENNADNTIETDKVIIDDKDQLNKPASSITVSNHDTTPDSMELSVQSKLDSCIITHYKPHSFESEQFRLLKTTILFPETGEPPRTIMVTSTAPKEGKSFVAANLAVTLANSIDEYVLLIDCDLRDPSIHKKFGLPDNIPGLSDYLSNTLPLSKILLKTSIDKLTIIPCGRIPDNPSELLSSDQMRQLITEVKTRYDDRYIILDSPPPYITAETNALARQVDAIIIVVKAGKTRKDDLKDLVDTYGKNKILGIVKNFDKPTFFSKTKYNYGHNV